MSGGYIDKSGNLSDKWALNYYLFTTIYSHVGTIESHSCTIRGVGARLIILAWLS